MHVTYIYIYVYICNHTICDPKQGFDNKKEKPRASIGARAPRTGDPGSPVLGHTGNFEAGKPMGSLGGITGRDQ